MFQQNLDRTHAHRALFTRISTNSAYWQPPGSSLIELHGVEQLGSLADFVDLRGEDNAYDEGIESMVTVHYRDNRVNRFALSELPPEAARERSPESIVRWVQPVPPDLPFHLHRPSDYRQRSGTFRPGLIERDLKEMSE